MTGYHGRHRIWFVSLTVPFVFDGRPFPRGGVIVIRLGTAFRRAVTRGEFRRWRVTRCY